VNADDGNILTDSIMLASFDIKQLRLTQISFPRDLWIDRYKTRINALYFYGHDKDPQKPTAFPKQVVEEMQKKGLIEKIDEKYFKEAIAKAILFKKAESIIFLGRLSKTDSDFLLGKTKYVLGLYLEKNKDNFKETDLIETDFRKEGVSISNALITGKIDKIVLDGSFAYVYDFKTGKPFESFDDKDEYGKLLAYKRQLIFYKLLIENSTTFSKYKVDKGFLEFMEPKNDRFDVLEFDIEEREVSRLKSLIEIVYQKIIDLDFPDINKYPQTVNGIKQFEDDLLSGSI
jgi:hypothetical protein